MVKDIICLIYCRNLFDSNEYLFDPKMFCLNQINFVSFKQNISLNQRKSFKQIIFLIQSNLFSECNPFSAKQRYIVAYAMVWPFLGTKRVN